MRTPSSVDVVVVVGSRMTGESGNGGPTEGGSILGRGAKAGGGLGRRREKEKTVQSLATLSSLM